MKRTASGGAPGETRAVGTLKGRLGRANASGSHAFRIQPFIGPEDVKCVFPSGKTEEFRRALGRKVMASGELTYPAGSDFPGSIKVETMEILPEDDELPSLSDLRGIAPGITGDLSSEEFVRMLRDVDDE